jgi:hypothetical protein
MMMVAASTTLLIARNGSTRSRLQLLLLCISLVLSVCVSTDIKWTSAASDATLNKDGKETAATAPRSQKYWIENNIEVPDYAKTDAELALERGQDIVGGGGVSFTKVLLVFAVLGAAVGYVLPRLQHGGGYGYTLQNGLLPRRHVSEEEARRARLSRFEPPDLSRFEAKDD